MRGLMAFAVVAALLSAGGCDRIGLPGAGFETEGNGPAAADAMVDEVASAEPGVDRRQWVAESDSARTVTGNLTATLPEGRGGPLVLAYANGVTLRLMNTGWRNAAEPVRSGGPSFAEILESEPRAGVFVYKVANERVDAIAPRGGLCGVRAATYAAITEFVQPSGEWVLRVAAFRGESAPAADAQDDPDLCAVYRYRLD